MSDLKQVAERLRKVRAANEVSNEAHIKACDEVYGFGENYGALLHDESEALDDWLAERDPTPLTVEVLLSFGFAITADSLISDWYRHFDNYTITLEWNIHDHCHVTVGDMLPIRTVGELRTLARLAGVELKGGG